jgi:hypothetical protein
MDIISSYVVSSLNIKDFTGAVGNEEIDISNYHATMDWGILSGI